MMDTSNFKNMPEAGVYCIACTVNGKRYIGSSEISVVKRMRGHLICLRNNRHPNKQLQHDWDEYGEDAFDFKILVLCEWKNLLKFEQLLINEFKTRNPKHGYNKIRVAGEGIL
jgi:group I intron endonuclease